MTWFTRSSRLTLLTLALTLGLTVYVPAQSQSLLTTASLRSDLPDTWQNTPPRGPNAPAPVNRESGGTRGPECVESNRSVIALVPAEGMATTVAKYPTVFWYMPPTKASSAEFVLQDGNGRIIYSAKYALGQSEEGAVRLPGIMSLTIPALATLAPLEIGQDYYWQLALVCNELDRSADLVVGGGIQRIERDLILERRIQEATPQEKVGFYARQGLWYETLQTLVELRREAPDDPELARAWDKLLNSVNLEVIAEEHGSKSYIRARQNRLVESSLRPNRESSP